MSCSYIRPDQTSAGIADSWFHICKESGQSYDAELIIPDCTPGIMYIHRGELQRQSRGNAELFSEGHIFLFGQKSTSVTYKYGSSGVDAYGVKLHPASIYSLFGVSASEITNTVINIADLAEECDEYPDMICNRSSDFLSPQTEIPHQLSLVLNCIHKSNGTLPIQQIADRLNLGYKRIERIFKLHVGLTPKMYSRIVRLNNSIRLGFKPNARLTDIAFQSGFFDQNHFIKEIKHFTGKIPREVFSTQTDILERNHLNYLNFRGY